MIKMNYLIFCFLFILNLVHAQEKLNWPIKGHQLIETHIASWEDTFIAIDETGNLSLFQVVNEGVQKKIIYEYNDLPDIVKHFALEKGHLVVAIFKEGKKIVISAFEENGKIAYKDTFRLPYFIEKADIRINDQGKILCLFYWFDNSNYVISLWEDGETNDIYRTEHSIEHLFFRFTNSSIHILYRGQNKYYWAIWHKGDYYRLELPFHILFPKFFSMGKNLFLLGLDTGGSLWRFSIRSNKLFRLKIISSQRLRFIDKLIPLVHKGQFQILMPDSKTNSVWRLRFSNFLRNAQIGTLNQKKVFTASKMGIIIYKNKISLLLQTELNQIYLTNWTNTRKKIEIYNVRWSLNSRKTSTFLDIQWQTTGNNKNYLYNYLLSDEKNAEPIGNPTSLSNNRVRIFNPKEGKYTFHLQITDSVSKKRSVLYHLPIFWRYQPPEPELVLLNEISPSVFLPGDIRFYIENQFPVEYFWAINQIPSYKPSRKLVLKSGIANLDGNKKLGWYYLHIRSKDPKSNRFSTTLHKPFAIRPYDSFQDKDDKQLDSIKAEIDFLSKELKNRAIEHARIKEIRKRLLELEKAFDQ